MWEGITGSDVSSVRHNRLLAVGEIKMYIKFVVNLSMTAYYC